MNGRFKKFVCMNIDVKMHCELHVMLEVYVGTGRGAVKGIGTVRGACASGWNMQDVFF